MTPLALWAAVALVALVATACWALLARETGVFVTSGLSYVAWTWLAITGGDTALVGVGSSGPLWVRDTIASLQFVCLALGLISLVVFSLRLFGAYPDASRNSTDSTDSATKAD